MGNYNFAGKVVMITGANGGIGNALVNVFAEQGADIIAHARKKTIDFEDQLQKVSKKNHVEVLPVYFDLTDYTEMKNVIRELMKEKKMVDVLVNNAGINHGSLFQLTSIDEIRNIFEVNLFAQMELTQLILKMMVRKRSGSVINIASNSGEALLLGNSAYGVSKAALIAWTKTLAAEMGKQGIRVNAIAPGLTDTQMGKDVEINMGKEMAVSTAMDRKAQPREIAEIALFLASEDSSFVNGQTIKADGEGDNLDKVLTDASKEGQNKARRAVLVTGAAGGLGLSIIQKLCEKKPWGIKQIIACAHSKNRDFEKHLEDLEQRYHLKIYPKYIELSNEESLAKLQADINKEQISIDILINNAGIAHGGFFQMTKVDAIRNVFDINLLSQVFLTNLLLKDMEKNEFGVIVNVASIAGMDLAQGNSAYGTSKAAVIEWTRELAEKYKGKPIYSFAVAPGLANTRMAGRMEEKARENMIAFSAMQRLAEPDEIASVIVEGIEEAPIFHGQVIRIDGGENRG